MSSYHIYMKRFGTDNDAAQPTKDLEADFPGLKYKSSAGLLKKGKPKNIYTEEYADSDSLRYYFPDEICREATDITLSLLFIGANRLQTFENFYSYVKAGPVYFWDSVRMRRAEMLLTEEVDPGDDLYKGSEPYLAVNFKFTNIKGETSIVTKT